MRKLRVNGGGNNLNSDFSELFGLIAESNNLSWAHEGKIQWIEEKN